MNAKINDMDEEELRARSDAAMLGRLRIMQDVIEALIVVSPNPNYIRIRLEQSLVAIQKERPDDPTLNWVPQAISAGATPLAKKFIDACGTSRLAQN